MRFHLKNKRKFYKNCNFMKLKIKKDLKIILDAIPKERNNEILWVGLFLVLATLSELCSIGAVVPFIALLVNADAAYSYVPFLKSYELTRNVNLEDVKIIITIAFVFASIFSGVFRLIYLRRVTKLAFGIGSDLSVRTYFNIINQKYSYFCEHKSSDAISAMTNGQTVIIYNVIVPTLHLIGSTVMMASVACFLIYLDPFIAVLSFVSLSLVYKMMALTTRLSLKNYSYVARNESEKIVSLLQESLGGARDIILDGSQNLYVKKYAESEKRLRESQSGAQFVATFPRYLVEAVAMVGIALFAYLGVAESDSSKISFLPMLGAFALGAQRLLPVYQIAYSSLSSIRGAGSAIDQIAQYLKLEPISQKNCLGKIEFDREIIVENVSYVKRNKRIIDSLTIRLCKGSKIGVVGKTGCGKSTLLDLIMGLLEPTDGRIIIDSTTLSNENVGTWQALISHVPQTVFLIDDTILNNIVGNVLGSEINQPLLDESIEISQLKDVISSLPMGIDTKVGERGINLSGGQIQRIAIARAIYKDAQLLILDEATSALDAETEQKIVTELYRRRPGLTIIAIAHRVSTLKFSDLIIELDHGKVVSVGSYDQAFGTQNA